ncbi:hypothetical protein F2P58_23495 [Vibrio fortis]|uniref:Uncharacterized protein n=1 Tax=Vibrio fortis TaxID=212667 RepID=A0A5N3QTI0_9VIBR|nr:hypothetical protein [Vibrio fortis]KAB0285478.1 hypothetical protein F2P58_23495 [Vibrio fortis]
MADNRAIRTFKTAQEKGTQWLTPDYYIEPLVSDADYAEADSLYESLKESLRGEGYYRDYTTYVESISSDSYCDVKYVLKNSKHEIVAYLGLWTKRATIRGFAQIPLVADYDPMATLMVKLWLFHHAPFDMVYYTMRYGYNKISPIDKYMGVVCLGRVNPHVSEDNAAHTFYFRTVKGGAVWLDG